MIYWSLKPYVTLGSPWPWFKVWHVAATSMYPSIDMHVYPKYTQRSDFGVLFYIILPSKAEAPNLIILFCLTFGLKWPFSFTFADRWHGISVICGWCKYLRLMKELWSTWNMYWQLGSTTKINGLWTYQSCSFSNVYARPAAQSVRVHVYSSTPVILVRLQETCTSFWHNC